MWILLIFSTSCWIKEAGSSCLWELEHMHRHKALSIQASQLLMLRTTESDRSISRHRTKGAPMLLPRLITQLKRRSKPCNSHKSNPITSRALLTDQLQFKSRLPAPRRTLQQTLRQAIALADTMTWERHSGSTIRIMLISKTTLVVKEWRWLPKGDSLVVWHRYRGRSPKELALGQK